MRKTLLMLSAVVAMQLVAAQPNQPATDKLLQNAKFSTFSVDEAAVVDGRVVVKLNQGVQKAPVFEQTITAIEAELRDSLGAEYAQMPIDLTVFDTPLANFITDITRGKVEAHDQIVRNLDRPTYEKGLSGRSIATWASHGWFYEPSLNRWEFQRARCHSTVEDISSTGYINAYLTPMLENAGAEVYMPRERDPYGLFEIVDNDNANSKLLRRKGKWEKAEAGYLHKNIIYKDENPFRMGTYLRFTADNRSAKNSAVYAPAFKQTGDYPVYVSWGNEGEKAGKAIYEVRHTGGVTSFEVDQKADGRTWYYLGTFRFAAGQSVEQGSVTVRASENCPAGAVVSTDAVRFGGGWGRVARGKDNMLSGAVAFAEGARYYLQAAGLPDSIYSPSGFKSDYNDDYRSRSFWVNHMKDQMNIPIDLSFAFHTDAGTTKDSTIVGTLMIYSTYTEEQSRMSNFTDGRSKLLSRDLADAVQTQICDDVRALHEPNWPRRELRDAAYHEAWKPDVPSMLLELLSHQNLADNRYHLDPRFRFTVSRAIYKGIVRYLNGGDCVIQPLAPVEFAVTPVSGRKVRLTWAEQVDPLEPTAVAKSYRVYTRRGDAGFDNGVEVKGTSFDFELPEWGVQYSFRVAAVNEGGESFPSEEMTACLYENQRPVLIVNGFTRVAAPLFFDQGEMAGVAWWEDEGVADNINTYWVGKPYDYYRANDWLDDDCPGWGASGSEGFNVVVAGNKFNFTTVHGNALAAVGRGFVSVSRAAFENPKFNAAPYAAVDVIMGEQKTSHLYNKEIKPDFAVYTPAMMAALRTLQDLNIPLLITGAYVGSDAVIENDKEVIDFMKEVLHYQQRNNHSSQTGVLMSVDADRNGFWLPACSIMTKEGNAQYRVEAPDALEPADKKGMRLYRYSDTSMNAGVAYDGKQRIVVLGFPFESIIGESERAGVMNGIMNFLVK